MNNVNISIVKVRELQAMIYDRNQSPNELFEKTKDIIEQMELASKEIQTNYADVSAKLTEHMRSGRIQ